MPVQEFWHGDMRLFGAYQKAYLRDKSFTAWINGQYNFTAKELSLANAFAKKGAKRNEYPKWKDPFEKEVKETITSENIEDKFREQQADLNAWLGNKMRK